MIFCFCSGEEWMSRGNYFEHGPGTDRFTLEYIHNVWKEWAFGLMASRVASAWRCKANREVNGCQNAGVTRDSCVKMSDYVQRQDQEKQDRTQKSPHKTEQQKYFVALSSVSFCLFLSLAVVHYHSDHWPLDKRYRSRCLRLCRGQRSEPRCVCNGNRSWIACVYVPETARYENRGTQRLFSVKYLFGEPSIA